MVDICLYKQYLFVVDTNQYAGNFEREMAAYMTGKYGDCGVGDREADIFNQEIGINPDDEDNHPFKNIIRVPDGEHGCNRPVTLVATPGLRNNGQGVVTKGDPKECKMYPAYYSIGIYFEDIPISEQKEIMMKRAEKFANYAKKYNLKQKIDIIGYRLLEILNCTKEIEL